MMDWEQVERTIKSFMKNDVLGSGYVDEYYGSFAYTLTQYLRELDAQPSEAPTPAPVTDAQLRNLPFAELAAEVERRTREFHAANQAAMAYKPSDDAPEYKNWGVAWFGKNGESGVCERCQQARRVYQGYNGGAHVGKFCAECQGAVIRNQA